MDDENRLPQWARQILIGIGLFFAGALFAFAYSYRPLHGALTWKTEQLEARLDERNRENAALRDQLASLESNEQTRIDPETLAQVKRELEQTQRVLAQTEQDLDKVDRQRKEASSSASTWRKRFEELRDESIASARVAESPGIPDPIGPSEESGMASPPASPAIPPATPSSDAVARPYRPGSPAPGESGMFAPHGTAPKTP